MIHDYERELRWGPMPSNPVIIRKKETVHRTGLSWVHIWRLEQRGEFPPRITLTKKAAGHYEHEVTAWIIARIRAGGRRMPAGCRGSDLRRGA